MLPGEGLTLPHEFRPTGINLARRKPLIGRPFDYSLWVQAPFGGIYNVFSVTKGYVTAARAAVMRSVRFCFVVLERVEQ